jgi:hypothetical protein
MSVLPLKADIRQMGRCVWRESTGNSVLDQQIELVAKLFNDPFELPATLGVHGRSDAEDGG